LAEEELYFYRRGAPPGVGSFTVVEVVAEIVELFEVCETIRTEGIVVEASTTVLFLLFVEVV
jgi:hypothetical protein